MHYTKNLAMPLQAVLPGSLARFLTSLALKYRPPKGSESPCLKAGLCVYPLSHLWVFMSLTCT